MTAPASPPYKVTLDVARQVLQLGHELGLPVEELLARHGIELTPLPDHPAFLAGPVFEQILGAGLRLLQDPLPGLTLAQRKIATVFGLAGFLVQTASTVERLLETLVRVEPLVGDTGITRLQRGPEGARLTWDTRFTDPYVRDHASDFILAGYAWAVQVAGRPGQPVLAAVRFRHAAPSDPLLLRRYLTTFGAPVYFGQPENALELAPGALALPLPSADPQLYEVLEAHARRLLEERRNAPSVVDLARSRLHQLLQAGDASRERLAEAMGITGRTLHRKLAEAGTSYRELLDALRLDRARALLREPALSIQEVAERAGFDESASFTRWFKGVAGITPSEYRSGPGRSSTQDSPTSGSPPPP